MNIYANRVAIVGVTGYAGQELERLLASHPKIQIAGKFASKANEKSGAEAFSFERLRYFSADAVVLATEHELSLQLVPQLLDAGYSVVDMSGAFRLKDPQLYQAWYGFEHTAPAVLGDPRVSGRHLLRDLGRGRLTDPPLASQGAPAGDHGRRGRTRPRRGALAGQGQRG